MEHILALFPGTDSDVKKELEGPMDMKWIQQYHESISHFSKPLFWQLNTIPQSHTLLPKLS